MLCLALVAVVLVFTNAVGNTGSPKVEATPAVTETPTPTPQANPISPIQSSAALAQTEDKGSTYVDQIYFLGDKSLKVLQSESMLTGKDAAKQYLRDHPEVAEQLEEDIRANAYKLMPTQAKAAAKAAKKAGRRAKP